jgi:hypothetical protein
LACAKTCRAGVRAMDNQFDFELVDRALLEELELTTDLMLAANASDGPLSQAEIDRILGVDPTPVVPRPRSGDAA